jgi:uncharacterized hydrophobic protein (TIGR00271 family)
MSVAIAVDPKSDLERQLRFALRLAGARDADLACLLPPAAANSSQEALAQAKTLSALQKAAAAHGGFSVAADPEATGAGITQPTARKAHCVALQGDGADGVLAALGELRPTTLVLVLGDGGDLDQALARGPGRTVLQRAGCEVVALRLGEGSAEIRADVLVPVAPGNLSVAPLQLGRDLVRAGEGKLIAVLVEPPIGAEAEAVGSRVLERRVTRALGREHADVVAHIVVARDEPEGLVRACEQDQPGLVLLGTSQFARLGDREASRLARQLLRRRTDLDVALVRAPLPMQGRVRQVLEAVLQRAVPQLDREQRVSLAERVQASSAWDFDFIALISLAALIAAMGLVQDSVAVVIGAMLVAPLMTPILGVGLALVHGNAALARLAARAIVFGVATAWVLGLLVGALHRQLDEPTNEMLSRGWPHPLDLVVAFVSGLAAAYATSRPNLVSALPGVAIAAALVPPLASSGLFASMGYGEAALGAFLLFLTNMVAIVLAAALALWAVGIRSVKGASRWTRVVGNTLIAASLALALYLGLSPEHDIRGLRVPDAAAAAIHARVEPRHRVLEASVRPGQPTAWLEVRLGGTEPPEPGLAAELAALVRPLFAEPIRVRVRAEWEAIEPAVR